MATLFALLRSGIRLLLFGAVLLTGIQVPAFVTQYEQRVDAHFREVSINIRGFQTTADALFAGDLDALVNYYRNSGDQVFNRDANSVAAIVDRYRLLAAEWDAMQGNSLSKAWHVVAHSDEELFRETTARYSYTVPLDITAILWGLSLALLLMICGDCVLACGRFCLHHWQDSRKSQRPGTHNETIQ